MKPKVHTVQELQNRWTTLEGQKSSILTLCEQYASWTLPYIFPPIGTNQSTELQISSDSIGAQAVNHLANKLVSVLFPGQRMFFRLHLDEKAKAMIKQMLSQNMAAEGSSAQDALNEAVERFEQEMVSIEKQASEYMDMVQYRPQAILAASNLIITGNALMYHPKGRPVQVFNLRDYCIVRDLSGAVIEIMTKECKAFETFHPDIQAQLRTFKGGHNTYEDTSEVKVYTQIKLENDGKYHAYQFADHVMLDTQGAVWTKDTLPWIPLTWNLVRGEDYGRGRVADFAGAFHAVNVLTTSLLNLSALMSDIKFLVDPASVIDIPTMTKSPSGSYHPGKKDQVVPIQVDKLSDAQFIASMIERYERQIAQGFLLNSQLTRNAERVTAEEIRRDANELETSNGGVYSRMAAQWQSPTAHIILYQIEFDGLDMGISPQIITGMDSLSRNGELENLQVFLINLAGLNNLPEDTRRYIDQSKYLSTVARNSQVEPTFVRSEEAVQAELQRNFEMQRQLQAEDANNKARADAAKTITEEQ